MAEFLEFPQHAIRGTGQHTVWHRQPNMSGRFVKLSGREGEAPAEPHARMQGVLKVMAQPELRPPRPNWPGW
jgi:hypothetical protein